MEEEVIQTENQLEINAMIRAARESNGIEIDLSEEELRLLNETIEAAFENTGTENTEEQESPLIIIPENSSTLLVRDETSRFSGAIWYDKIKEQELIVGGAGGISSYVLFLLSRLQPRNIKVYDPDTVETVNMAGQLYSRNDVGSTKVSAMGIMMANYSNFYNVSLYNELFTTGKSPKKIMICGFDNMQARKDFFEVWERQLERDPENRNQCLFIDGRLNAEEFQVLCINGADTFNIDRYKQEFLFDDSEVEEALCSYKQTSFCANMIASVMVNLFVNHCANLCEPVIDRDLPFFTSYSADMMFFKTEN